MLQLDSSDRSHYNSSTVDGRVRRSSELTENEKAYRTIDEKKLIVNINQEQANSNLEFYRAGSNMKPSENDSSIRLKSSTESRC